MKKINVTFSIPIETNELLHALIGRKKLSTFVASTLNKALEEKMEALKKEYIEAEKDPDRKKTIEEWKILDAEGWE
jgi:hypothetical protein